MSLKGKVIDIAVKTMVKVKNPTKLLGQEPMTEGEWYKALLQNCVCADGTECCTYLRKGKNSNLIILFMGGGVSFDENTAAYPGTIDALFSGEIAFYTSSMGYVTDFGLFLANKKPGILHRSKENIFSDWNIAIISYASADFHVGNNKVPYTSQKGEKKVLHHDGIRNFKASMDIIKRQFSIADKLLIAGGSAGAFAVPALATDVMEYYDQCRDITVYSDSSLLVWNDWKNTVQNIWRSHKELIDAALTDNICADWYRMLVKNKGTSIRYLFSCSTHDSILAKFQNYLNNGELIATEEICNQFDTYVIRMVGILKELNPSFGIYINSFPDILNKVGTEHCVITSPSFTEGSVEGIAPEKWLSDAVNGNIYDVGLKLLEK